MVEWLEWLGYGIASRRKAGVRGWASPCDNWKTLSVNPVVNGYFFELGKDKAAKERDGLMLSLAVPKI